MMDKIKHTEKAEILTVILQIVCNRCHSMILENWKSSEEITRTYCRQRQSRISVGNEIAEIRHQVYNALIQNESFRNCRYAARIIKDDESSLYKCVMLLMALGLPRDMIANLLCISNAYIRLCIETFSRKESSDSE